MRSRSSWVLAVPTALAVLVTVLPPLVERFSSPAGLARSVFTQVGFGGVPIEARTTEINLSFLDADKTLPRQNFSVRWRGFMYVSQPQTIEFFAGGNDEVELRVDGEVLLTRNLRDGMRTAGRKVALDAGAHEIAVDYQQFGGGMALNIQRALEEQQPAPFAPEELFARRVESHHVLPLHAARLSRQITPYMWIALVVLFIVVGARTNLDAWRSTGAPRNAREYARRVWLFAAPAFLVPAVVFVLGPHTIYANNSAEFSVGFGELMSHFLRTAGIHWIMLMGVGAVLALLSEGWTRAYAAGLFALGLLFWGQGNLWNADYGVLAGQDLDLTPHAWRAPFELAAWAAVVLLAVLAFRPISRLAPFASVVFLAVQITAALFADTQSATADRVQWIEPPADIYHFSSVQNVIHIVLDEFQGDVFNDIFTRDRAALDRQFTGFQYFADHAGSFPTTSFSMPAMLAGQEYRNEKPAPEFVRQAFAQSSIFDKVSRAGYDVDAATIVPVDSFEQWMGPEATPNWKGSRFRIRKPYVSREDYREVTARQLLELSLFRHVPHTAKAFSVERPDTFYRPILMDRTESPAQVRRHEASNSAAFLDQFVAMMNVGRDRPVYKLLHVGVPHRPIVVDRECRFIGITDMSRESYTEQSRCAVKLVASLLERARALGIYDSSLIIVSSDHGTDLQPLGFAGQSPSLSLIPGPSTVRLPAIVSTAKAVMLIKPPNAAGPIAVSNAPTSHVDLPSTILDVLGIPGASPDAVMTRRDPARPRTRLFGMYNPHERFPNTYLDRVDVLTIDGPVLDAAAWNVRQLIWRPDLRLEAREVDAGARAGNLYLGPGWSLEKRERVGDAGEISFVQALTDRAIISASLPAEAVQLVLRASSPSASGPRSVRADVDGRPAGQANLGVADGYRDITIAIPGDPARPPVSTITLHFDSGGRDTFEFKLDRFTIR